MKYVPGTYNANLRLSLELFGFGLIIILVICIIIWHLTKHKKEDEML